MITPKDSSSVHPEDDDATTARESHAPDRTLRGTGARDGSGSDPLEREILNQFVRDLLEREILNEFVRDLTGAGASPQLVLERLADAARRIAQAAGTCVLQVEGDSLAVAAARGTLVPFEGQRFTLLPPPSLLQEVLVSQRPLFTNNTAAAPHLDAAMRVQFAVEQAAVAPIIIDGAVTAMLLCVNAGRGAFTHDDMSSLQRLADHTALALHSARLMRAAELALAEARTREAEARSAADKETQRAMLVGAARESEDAARRTADEEAARRKAEEEAARRQADAEARRTFEAETMQRAAVEARRMADEELERRIADEAQRREAADVARRAAEAAARAAAEADAAERADSVAREARERVARELGAQVSTGTALAGALTRDDLHREVQKVIRDNLDGSGCSVFTAESETHKVAVDFEVGGAVVDHDFASAILWPARAGLPDLVAEPLFIPDVANTTNLPTRRLREPLLAAGITALAALPLATGTHVVGLVVVHYKAPRTFDESERMVLANFAAQFAVALRRAGHLSQLEKRAHRLTALAEAQQRLSRILAPETLLPAIAEEVSRVMPDVDCDLLFGGTGGLRCVYAMRQGKPVPATQESALDLELAKATFLSGVARIGQAVAPGFTPLHRAVELCSPVRFGRRSMGVLRLRSESGSFDFDDLEFIGTLARHAGAALETARLFRSQDIDRQRAETVADLARSVLQAERLGQGATSVLETLDRVVPSAGKALAISRGVGRRLEFVATSGALSLLTGKSASLDSIPDTVLAEGRAFEVPTVLELAPDADPGFADYTAVALHFTLRDDASGVLVLGTPIGTRLELSARASIERLAPALASACEALLAVEQNWYSHEREHLLALAVTTMNQPIFILEGTTIRYANPAAIMEYGWSMPELTMMPIEQVVGGGHLDPTTDAAALVPDMSTRDVMHRRRDGSRFPAAVTRNVITARNGAVVGEVIGVRNMAAEHEAQAHAHHTEKMVALGELVAGIAHEINNPLTGISAFAELLLEQPLGEEERESVNLIKRESDRAAVVIRDLLLFARKDGANVGPIDINALLEQTVRLRAYRLRSENVDVALLLDPQTPLVLGDSQKLQRALLSIINNAEYAMHGTPQARLTLRTTRVGGRVQVEVGDNGVGMAPEESRRIFEPFYTTRPAGEGTGLGLSVSYGIIQAHNGTVDVRSEPGVGTTILIELPGATRTGLFDRGEMDGGA